MDGTKLVEWAALTRISADVGDSRGGCASEFAVLPAYVTAVVLRLCCG